jgi:hypothetical protein
MRQGDGSFLTEPPTYLRSAGRNGEILLDLRFAIGRAHRGHVVVLRLLQMTAHAPHAAVPKAVVAAEASWLDMVELVFAGLQESSAVLTAASSAG